MEQPVEVDTACSSLDILPTLLNLFGFEYDSRLLMGTDVFSGTAPTVVFADKSFITDEIFTMPRTAVSSSAPPQLPRRSIWMHVCRR